MHSLVYTQFPSQRISLDKTLVVHLLSLTLTASMYYFFSVLTMLLCSVNVVVISLLFWLFSISFFLVQCFLLMGIFFQPRFPLSKSYLLDSGFPLNPLFYPNSSFLNCISVSRLLNYYCESTTVIKPSIIYYGIIQDV